MGTAPGGEVTGWAHGCKLYPFSIIPPLPASSKARRLLHLGRDSFAWQCAVSQALYTFRNKDFQEVTLEREGQVLLRFAVAYGFRNIQNLVQKLKRGRCPYHYVEVMACPSGSSSYIAQQLAASGRWKGLDRRGTRPLPTPGSQGANLTSHHALCSATGCLNGGGQLKAPDMQGWELLQQVERLYSMVRNEAPEDAPGVQELYQHWLRGEGSEQTRRLLHTQYHAVEKTNSGLSIRW